MAPGQSSQPESWVGGEELWEAENIKDPMSKQGIDVTADFYITEICVRVCILTGM